MDTFATAISHIRSFHTSEHCSVNMEACDVLGTSAQGGHLSFLCNEVQEFANVARFSVHRKDTEAGSEKLCSLVTVQQYDM